MSNSTGSLNLTRSHHHHHNHTHRTNRDSSSNRVATVPTGLLSSSHSPSLNNYLSQSYGGFGAGASGSSLGLAGAAATTNGLSSSFPSNAGLDPSMSSQQQVFYLTPNTQRTADQLTEEEQIKLLKRMTLIQQLPTGSFDENKKHKE